MPTPTPNTIQNQRGIGSRSDSATAAAAGFGAAAGSTRRTGFTCLRPRLRQAQRFLRVFGWRLLQSAVVLLVRFGLTDRGSPIPRSRRPSLRRPPRTSPVVSTAASGAVATLPGDAQHGDDEQRRQQRDDQLPEHGAFRHARAAACVKRAPQSDQRVAAMRRQLLRKRAAAPRRRSLAASGGIRSGRNFASTMT